MPPLPDHYPLEFEIANKYNFLAKHLSPLEVEDFVSSTPLISIDLSSSPGQKPDVISISPHSLNHSINQQLAKPIVISQKET